MPTLALEPDKVDANPFADLLPADETNSQLIGGGTPGADATQIVNGKVAPVPKGVAVSTTLDRFGPFSDLVQARAESVAPTDNYGMFSDLVPKSSTSETEKALAETPMEQEEQAQSGAIESSTPEADTGLLHQGLNAVRVFGSAAGRYLFNGLERLSARVRDSGKSVDDLALARLTPDEHAQMDAQLHHEVFSYDPVSRFLHERAANLAQESEVDPALANTIPARLANAAGSATILGMESLLPGAGLPLMTLHGALTTEQEALNAGKSQSEAEQAGVRSAIGLGLMGGASKAASIGVAALVGKDASVLTKFVSQFVGQDAANEVSTSAMNAWEAAEAAKPGEKLHAALTALVPFQNLETSTLNAVYAGMHAANVAGARPAVEPAKEPERPASEPAPALATERDRVQGTPASEAQASTVEAPVEPAPEIKSSSEPPAQAEAQPGAAAATDASAVSPKSRGPADGFGSELTPIASHITDDLGGVISKTQAKARGVFDENSDLWDGAPALEHPTHNKVYNPNGVMPDVAAQSLFDAGLTRDPTPDTMWSAVGGESRTARMAYRAERSMPETELLNALGGADKASLRERAAAGIKSGSQVMRDLVAESQKQSLLPQGSQGIRGTAEWLSDAWKQVRDVPRLTEFKTALFSLGKELQTSTLDAKALQKQIKRAVPDKTAREGIFNYMDAGGDQALLQSWAQNSTDPKLKRGYEAALKLTPEQTKVADQLKTFYDAKLAQGQKADVLRDGLEGYVNRIVDKRSSRGFDPTGPTGIATAKFTTGFRHSLGRQYEYAFDAERNGIRYATKDVAELAPIYSAELNRAIATRKFIGDLTEGTAKDGRALAYPKGSAVPLGTEEAPEGKLIKPNTKQAVYDELTGKDESSRDYVTVQHPALNAHKWIGTDANGKPILMRGDLALHPDIAKHVKNIVSGSAIREWYNSPGTALSAIPKGILRNIDKVNSTAKQFLFSGSGFHHMTMATKGHMVGAKPLQSFVRSLRESSTIDPHDPRIANLMAHGLQLAPDYASANRFMEGFGGSAVEKIPLYGSYVKAVSDQLFERFIPAMKVTLTERTFATYKKAFAKELQNQDVNEHQLLAAASDYANKALSHQNYIAMGRSPTMQHILSLGLLAPDFNESRFRYLGDVASGLTGSKIARPALKSFAYGMALTYGMARILNQVVDNDPHWDLEDAFSVIHDGRRYSLRTIQGDVGLLIGGTYHALQGDITGTAKFLSGRLSPLAKLTAQMFYPVNYRGEKITGGEAAREFIANYVPIWAKSLPGVRGLTQSTAQNPVSPLEQFMGAMGFHISRYSPITKAYQLAAEWKKTEGIPADTGTYPVSKYQQLRYALEDGDMERAQEERQKLVDSGEKQGKLAEGFKSSLLHPFTGSQASDRKFRASLDSDQRLLYDAAVQRRREILARFHALRLNQ